MSIECGTDVSAREYDVVIVGAGISGALVAKLLSQDGRRVLVLEAGTGQALDYAGYRSDVERYYTAGAKVPNSPYSSNKNAPQPDVLDIISQDPAANSRGYFVQRGPLPYRSDYVRSAGGTTLHWLGTCLRMLPEDFKTRTLYGVGLDWPLTYLDLKPYYEKAELEIGVSANIEDQIELEGFLALERGWFDPDYVYPMQRIPPTFVDQTFRAGVADLRIQENGASYPVRVTSTPQARNSIPNPRYPGGYEPIGAVGNPNVGQRCEGHSSCIPICPIQAKYNSLKTLNVALQTGRVDVVTQAVASKINVGKDGRVREIVYKAYQNAESSACDTYVARGRIFVLAANPVENSRLLLSSDLGGPSVGRYLMDHPILLTWGLADRHLGTFRGPGSSAGIESLRGGAFRKMRAPFRVEIDNWGWNWAANAPTSTVQDLVYNKHLFGGELREALLDLVQRQVRLGFLLELPPDAANRITIDPNARDRLGNCRPVIYFDLPDYVKAGFAAAKRTSDTIYAKMGIADHTVYNTSDPGYVTYQGSPYVFNGAGHFVGGHIMGSESNKSVVNTKMQVWGHENLWLVGCGNMVTEGTSNPTLTMAALTLMAAEHIRAAART